MKYGRAIFAIICAFCSLAASFFSEANRFAFIAMALAWFTCARSELQEIQIDTLEKAVLFLLREPLTQENHK